MLPLEAVPNFSEGRDRATIDAIGGALAAHSRLLDVHSDDDHNRSVYTMVGSEDEDLHQISNLQADAAELVTLHVYSPPLIMMGTYSLTDHLRGEEPMFLDFAEAEGI